MNDNNINSGNNNVPQQPAANNTNQAPIQNNIEQQSNNLQDMFQTETTQQINDNINTTPNVNEQPINNNDALQNNMEQTNNTSQEIPQNNTEQDAKSENQIHEPNTQQQPQQQINNKQDNKKSSKPILIIILVIVAIIIAIFLAKKFLIKATPKDKKISSLYSKDTPIKVLKNKKYGYIDQKGNFVIEPKYDDATEFYGDYAIVEATGKIDDNEVKLYQVIDKKGNVKATAKFSDDIKYIDEYDIWIIEEKLYDGTLKKISPDNLKIRYQGNGYLSWEDISAKKAGIMKNNGKITYTYNFKEKESYIGIDVDDIDESLKEKYCRITIENKKYAIVNCDTGKVVYDYTDNYISNQDDNIFEVSTKDDYKFISIMYIQNDKIMYESSNDKVSLDYYPDGRYLIIEDYTKDYDEKYSYLDLKTGKQTNKRPESEDKTEKLDEWEKLTKTQKFSCNSGYGIMSGKTVKIPCEWSDIEYLELPLYKYLSSIGKEYIIGGKNNKSYLINLKDGKFIQILIVHL